MSPASGHGGSDADGGRSPDDPGHDDPKPDDPRLDGGSAPDGVAGDGGSVEEAGGPVLLFDGVCALCNWTVRVVLRLDKHGRIRFAPLDGEYGAQVLERRPEARDVDSLILVEPERVSAPPGRSRRHPDGAGERVHVKSDAVLWLAQALGWPWRAAAALRLVPRPVRDWAYDVIARHRYALFGRFARRPDPLREDRGRFLD